jgi:hypothetical protein
VLARLVMEEDENLWKWNRTMESCEPWLPRASLGASAKQSRAVPDSPPSLLWPHDRLTPTGAVLLSPHRAPRSPTALILLQVFVHIRCATAILWRVGAARKIRKKKSANGLVPQSKATCFAILLAKLDG